MPTDTLQWQLKMVDAATEPAREISHAASNFYGTEIEIWAGFGPVGSNEKHLGPIMSNF